MYVRVHYTHIKHDDDHSNNNYNSTITITVRIDPCINQQQHKNKQTYLKRLDESPQQRSDALTTTQQFDQSHHTEQSEEIDADNRLALLQ